MASKTIRIVTSDLTGQEIDNDAEVARIRVLRHPDLKRPVKLDAYVLEVQSLLDAHDDYVTLELDLPGQESRRAVVSAENFARLFTTDVDETLAAAEPLDAAPTARSSRDRYTAATTTRTKTAKTISMSREQRGAVRNWANNNGFHVGDRGRIKSDVIAAFEAAHTN